MNREGEIIMAAATLAHIPRRGELAQRTGIKDETLYKRFKPGGQGLINLNELRAIDRKVHLTDEQIISLVRGGEKR